MINWYKAWVFMGITTVYLIVSLICMHGVLSEPGQIGLRHDWELPFDKSGAVQGFQRQLQAWSIQNLGGRLLYRLILPFEVFLFGPPATGIISPQLWTRVFLLLVLTTAGCSAYWLARILGVSLPLAVISGLAYVLSATVFNRLVAGHLYYVWSYSLTPIAIALFFRAVDKYKLRFSLLLMCGLVLGCAITGIKYVVFASMFFGAYAIIFGNSLKKFTRISMALTVVVMVAMLLHFPTLVQTLGRINQVIQSGIGQADLAYVAWASSKASAANVLRGLGYVASYFEAAVVSGPVPVHIWEPASWLVTFIAVGALIIRHRDGRVLVFSLIWLSSILLGMGTSGPWPKLFKWFVTSPVGAAFRNPYGFSGLSMLAASVLIGVGMDSLSAKIIILKRLRTSGHVAFVIIGAVIVILNGYPLFFGISKQLQTFAPARSYKTLREQLSTGKHNTRVIWLPMLQPVLYQGLAYPGFDPLISFSPLPTLSQTGQRYSYSDKVTTFLASSLQQARTQYLGALVSIANVEYLVWREDAMSLYYKYAGMSRWPRAILTWSNGATTGEILTKQVDLISWDKDEWTNFRVYCVPEPREIVDASDKLVLVVGDLTTLVTMHYSQLARELDEATFLFVEQIDELPAGILEEVGTVVIDPGQFLDLEVHFLEGDSALVIGPHQLSSFALQQGQPAKPESADRYWWLSWYIAGNLEPGFLLTAGQKPLTLGIEVPDPGEFELWAKITVASDNAIIRFSWGTVEREIRVAEGTRWVKVFSGDLDRGEHRLSTHCVQGDVVLSKLLLVPPAALAAAQQRTNAYLAQKRVVILQELERFGMVKTDCIATIPVDNSWRSYPHQINIHSGQSYNTLSYVLHMSPEESVLQVQFNQSSQVDEFVDFRKEVDYALGDSLFLSVRAMVSDSRVGMLQFGFEIDVNNDGIADGTVWSSPHRPSVWTVCEVDVNALMRAMWPDVQEARIKALRILFHKNWGVDATCEMPVDFRIKSLRLLRKSNSTPDRMDPSLSCGTVLLMKGENTVNKLEIKIPYGAEYHWRIRAGGTGCLTVADHEIMLGSVAWHDLGNVALTSGQIWALTLGLHGTEQASDADGNYLSALGQIDLLELVADAGGSAVPEVERPAQVKILESDGTKYELEVQADTAPFFLVLGVSFDDGWEAYVNGEIVSQTDHFLANGYANGWVIRKAGQLDVRIVYKPQASYEIGLVLSLVTGMLVPLCAAFLHWRSYKLTKDSNP